MRLTGVKDADIEILNKLDDRSLLNFCLTDKSASEICRYDPFWMNRLRDRYPDAEKYFQDYGILFSILSLTNPEINNIFQRADTWREYYLQTVYYVNKMKEDREFEYKTGNPRDYYIILYGIRYPHVQVQVAARSGYIDLLEYFIGLGGSYSVAAKSNLFIGAGEGGQKKVVEHFWRDSLPVDSANFGLLGAVLGNNIDLVKFFISKGANNYEKIIKTAMIIPNKEIIDELNKMNHN